MTGYERIFLLSIVAIYANILAWFLPAWLRPAVQKKLHNLLSTMSQEVQAKSVEIAMISADFCANSAAILVVSAATAAELWRSSTPLPLLIIFLLAIPAIAALARLRWLDQSEDRYNRRLGRLMRWLVLLLSVAPILLSSLQSDESPSAGQSELKANPNSPAPKLGKAASRSSTTKSD